MKVALSKVQRESYCWLCRWSPLRARVVGLLVALACASSETLDACYYVLLAVVYSLVSILNASEEAYCESAQAKRVAFRLASWKNRNAFLDFVEDVKDS